MGRGRRPGYRVTHGLASSTPDGPSTTLLGYAFVRCTCSRPFRADTLEEAAAAFGEHLDRVEAAGKQVHRG